MVFGVVEFKKRKIFRNVERCYFTLHFDVSEIFISEESCMSCCMLQEVPYVIMHNGKNYSGNSRFYGFCVDLLERVAKEVGFDYILDLVPDKKYGARDAETGEWNGMVFQLMQHVRKSFLKYPSISLHLKHFLLVIYFALSYYALLFNNKSRHFPTVGLCFSVESETVLLVAIL